MTAAPQQSVKADVLHWLYIISGILAGMSEAAAFVDWIPGRYGHLAVAFFAVIAITRAIILKVEKRLETTSDVFLAVVDALKDVSPDLKTLLSDGQKLAQVAQQFAPKKK